MGATAKRFFCTYLDKTVDCTSLERFFGELNRKKKLYLTFLCIFHSCRRGLTDVWRFKSLTTFTSYVWNGINRMSWVCWVIFSEKWVLFTRNGLYAGLTLVLREIYKQWSAQVNFPLHLPKLHGRDKTECVNSDILMSFFLITNLFSYQNWFNKHTYR